uniref:uncharacterized protein LOC101307834 n=1 Tax=Fragaria vesca subsp. vesca TaxID=101020 RepID=UPI0005CB6E74|nr:PREDICTED: uncharacterized protein LOC101307834 [Fragaria vesca subsp. vesca]
MMFFGIRSIMPSKHLVFFVILAISSFVFVVSASADETGHQLSHTEGEELNDGGIITWGRRRSLEEGDGDGGDDGDQGDEEVLLLAKKRTQRRDPLDHWKKYNGGWNITNEHYLTSVAFTAVPFFIFALVWFVIFGIALCVICICYCCRKKPPYGYSRIAYCVSLVTLIVFTLMAIAGCIVLYTGQGKFYNSTRKTLDYIANEADVTAENLRNVSDFLDSSKKIGLDAIVLPQDMQRKIDEGTGKVKKVADVISEKTDSTAKKSRQVLHNLKLALLIFATVMLLLVFIGFVLSMCGKRFLVYCLVIVGWILVTCTFILCGAFLLIHNVFADACVSMDEWVQKKPTAYTALDDFLPCVDQDVVQGMLNDTKMANYAAIGVVNQIVDMANSDPNSGDGGTPLSFNQSGPLLPPVCNPYNEDQSNRTCAPGEVEMQKVTEEWGKYVCQVGDSGQCESTGRLTPTYFDQVTAFVNVSYGLYRYGPYFADFADCTIVKKTFTDMFTDHCPGLVLHSKWIYIGLLMVALAKMLSMIFWVIYCRERRHRVYTKTVDTISNQSANFGGSNLDSANQGSKNLAGGNHGSASHGSSHYGSAYNG